MSTPERSSGLSWPPQALAPSRQQHERPAESERQSAAPAASASAARSSQPPAPSSSAPSLLIGMHGSAFDACKEKAQQLAQALQFPHPLYDHVKPQRKYIEKCMESAIKASALRHMPYKPTTSYLSIPTVPSPRYRGDSSQQPIWPSKMRRLTPAAIVPHGAFMPQFARSSTPPWPPNRQPSTLVGGASSPAVPPPFLHSS